MHRYVGMRWLPDVDSMPPAMQHAPRNEMACTCTCTPSERICIITTTSLIGRCSQLPQSAPHLAR